MSKTEYSQLPRELDKLPHWARVAYLVRWAKVTRHLYLGDPESQRALDNLIKAAEESGTQGQAVSWYSEEQYRQDSLKAQWTSANAAAWDSYVSHAYSPQKQEIHFADYGMTSIAVSAISGAFGNFRELAWIDYVHTHLSESGRKALQLDFENLLTAAKTRGWSDATPVPQSFFALHTEFDLYLPIAGSTIIEVIPAVYDELIARLRDYPQGMLTLSPRQFEELIAKIWEGFGFKVELTCSVRDGGRDVIAIDYKDQRKYLIECKRYRQANVGIEIVQRLHGTVQGEGATKGIIVTTKGFTRPAQEFLNREAVKWRLEGKDFDGLVSWIEEYEALRTSRFLNTELWKSDS